MSDPPSSSPRSEPDNAAPQSHPPSSSTPSHTQPQRQQQQQTPPTPNPNPAATVVPPAPVTIPPYGPPPISGGPAPLSFRPVPQFSPWPNYQNAAPGVHPPGVSSSAAPAQIMGYQVPPGQPPNPALRPYGAPPIPNGYSAVPPVGGVATPLVIPRYPALPMVRPLFPPRPPGAPVVLPAASRPMVPGALNVRPVIAPLVRPIIPSVTPAEKPQISVYVGKIASTVEDDFMRSVLQVCGPVKNWKRVQDPNGTLRGFGFCEYESAEGLLRALRLFNKFNIDGQELLLNITGATKEYLKRYVQKKTENSKNVKKDEGTGSDKDEDVAKGGEKDEPSKSAVEDSSNESDKDKKIHDLAYSGIVTDEDKEADREALEKLTSMIEERLKNKPLAPPPPQLPADGTGNLNSDLPAKSRDGESDATKARSGTGEDKNDDETTSDNKAASEQLDRADTSSPDRRRYDRKSRDRDRDIKREKEREIERYERETERERIRKEREQRRKMEEAEREYEERLKDWEYREREKEKQRQYEKEKERERKRRKEILYDEEEDDDNSRKRWRRSALEEKRRKRLREKEEDLADRIKEEEEIAEAKRRSEEEKLQKQQNDTLNLSSGHAVNGSETTELAEEYNDESKEKGADQDDIGSVHENHTGGVLQNPNADESIIAEGDMRQNNNAPATRKLGFGLVGSGKRAVVPSVFNEEDDDDAHKDKRTRPLVPIDYSTEEMQAVQPTVSGAQPNLVAAAEFARRISNVKDEKPDAERERNRRYNDRSSQQERDRDQNDEDINRTKDDKKEKILERERDREHGLDKVKTPDKQKLLDAKQLIDMIPKTKDELFSYEINWAVYDKHELHERMRPWISKKITEFLGEEETTLVDYIVSSTQEHVKASKMLELLQSILDEEAEMFVLKMWRMLIFEIKKVETGLVFKSKT